MPPSPVDSDDSLFHRLVIDQQRVDADLLTIELGSAPLSAPFRRFDGKIGDGIGFDTGHQMIACLSNPFTIFPAA
jgi:hypothetical protein